MAKSLQSWVSTDVAAMRDKPLSWLSQHYFFRDPCRPAYNDRGYFFSPADGVILYQGTLDPTERILDLKGKRYSLQEAMRDDTYDKRSVVVGVFMTFFDVHVNRIPYPGRLSYRELEAIDTFNYPMLEVEKSLVDELRLPTTGTEYLRSNQRVINRID